MKRAHRTQYFVGMIFVLAVVVFLLHVFSMLSQTNKVDQCFVLGTGNGK